MKIHLCLKIFAVLTVFLVLRPNAAAYNMLSEDPVRGFYQHEGAVVSVPANFAASVTQLAFFGVSVPPIAVVDCLYTPFSPYFYTTNFSRHVNDANVFIHDYVRLIGYYPVGLPFYIVKKTLWDGPRWMVFSIFGLEEYGGDGGRDFELIHRHSLEKTDTETLPENFKDGDDGDSDKDDGDDDGNSDGDSKK